MAKKSKKKWYVVWEGKQTGVFDNWDDCKEQTDGYKGAVFKSYESELAAKEAFNKKAPYTYNENRGYAKSDKVNKKPKVAAIDAEMMKDIDKDSLCVDSACSGAVGPMEYRGVWFETGEEAFKSKVFPKGTNNMGEFLAIVDGIRMLEKLGESKTIYSDSKTARSWVSKKAINSTLVRDEETEELWGLVEEAVSYLRSANFEYNVMPWLTKLWKEIPADFGRK